MRYIPPPTVVLLYLYLSSSNTRVWLWETHYSVRYHLTFGLVGCECVSSHECMTGNGRRFAVRCGALVSIFNGLYLHDLCIWGS